MKTFGLILALAINPAVAFVLPHKLVARTPGAAFALPRIVEDPLPKIYVYDHW